MFKRKLITYLYLFFLAGPIAQIIAQKAPLLITIQDDENNLILNQLTFQTNLLNPQQFSTEIDNITQQLHKLGFLNAQIQKIPDTNSAYAARIKLNHQIKRCTLTFNSSQFTNTELRSLPGMTDHNQLHIPFTSLQKTLDKLTTILDQKGQAFSIIRLSHITIKKDKLLANVVVNPHKMRYIDKIIIEGYPQLSTNYLRNYLQLNTGAVFRKSDLTKFSRQINSIPFLTQLKTPEVLFTKDSTHIYFFLQKKMINKFDGLLGFTTKNNGSGIQFNGYLNLALHNLFHGGETLGFSWKNNGQKQQYLTLHTKVPYIFNTAISPQFNVGIYKQDSTYINTSTELTLGYALKFNHEVGLNTKWTTSSSSTENPITPSFNHFYYGLFYHHFTPYDNPLFPEKININLSLYTGNRTTTIKSKQSNLKFTGSYLWRLKNQHHIYISNETKLLWSENYYANELFRLGGTNSIRGFNEDQFFSNAYTVINLEYRFSPNNKTYLYSISDFGSLENKQANSSTKLYSFGLGYVFQTNLGSLNLSYAIGGVTHQTINLNNARVHLKFITNF
ncbi:hypothetical protein MWU59_04140 [Flavobacteriaceae bacterium F08102]|nr:hypothetical protein [Flavobacteriaceae bacterium F08102]